MSGDWWDRGNVGVEEGLGLYKHHVSRNKQDDIERRFEETSLAVQRRSPRYLTADDLIVVIDFKTPPVWQQRAHNAAESQRAEVERITTDALELSMTHEVGALKLLTGLTWVAVPTASAILAMAMPERFGVIDRFVMGEVGRLVVDRLRVGQSSRSPALLTLADALTTWVQGESF